ncbi:MAG: sporulation membrane protein YtaF [Thermoanaerobacteraceae bacterium]|nr:sporulation membrane protein YtaF [Thermoanaerobacteraceae bacterium]
MELLSIIVFALALNMDALGTGVVYGVRGIRLPFTSVLIISLMSVAAIGLSMTAGQLVARIISETSARHLGGVIIILIGLRILIQSVRERNKGNWRSSDGIEDEEEPRPVVQLRIRPLGVMVQVLREPHRADLDRSGVISAREAALLGLALALDAFSAGFAFSMLGFNLLLTTLLVGIGDMAMIYAGLLAGRGFGTTALGRQFTALPGCILIMLGILKLR